MVLVSGIMVHLLQEKKFYLRFFYLAHTQRKRCGSESAGCSCVNNNLANGCMPIPFPLNEILLSANNKTDSV